MSVELWIDRLSIADNNNADAEPCRALNSAAVSFRSRPLLPLLLTAALLFVLVVLARLTWEAHAALQRGQQRQSEGAVTEATAHYLDAARAYYPGNVYAGAAFQRLLDLAQAKPAVAGEPAPRASDEQTQRRALEAFRAAALSTRSFYTPHALELEQVNRRLAAIYARWELRLPGATRVALSERMAWHLEKLTLQPGPSTLWSAVALVGLVLWLGAVFVFIAKAMTPNLKIKRTPALGAALAFLCGFTLFLVGLSQ